MLYGCSWHVVSSFEGCIVVGCIVDINVTLLMYCEHLLFYR